MFSVSSAWLPGFWSSMVAFGRTNVPGDNQDDSDDDDDDGYVLFQRPLRIFIGNVFASNATPVSSF